MPSRRDERIYILAGPAYQSPVDIRLRHQFGDVLRRDAAPIKDGQLRPTFWTILPGDPFPDEAMNLLSLSRPKLQVNAVIAFGEEGAPLRMADDDTAAACLAKHLARDLAGIGSLF